MDCSWKPNWEETKKHFTDWWAGEGFVLGSWYGLPRENPHEVVPKPDRPDSLEERYTNPEYRALRNHYRLSQTEFVNDVIPVAETDIGPGALGLMLGGKADFSEGTVWIHPGEYDMSDPESIPELKFDESNRWWRTTENILKASVAKGKGKYITGCPDLVENIDTLSLIFGKNKILKTMQERPVWVKQKLDEVNTAWQEAFSRLYDIIKLEDGSMATDDFRLWGPGKTDKVQCDSADMISHDQFTEFVAPALEEQCGWLDNAVFHLHGHRSLTHLDSIIALPGIDAIEWTPDPTVPSGGNSEWYPLYRQILEGGKSVQAINVRPDEVVPLLDNIGGKGVYIVLTAFTTRQEAEELWKKTEQFR